jgi:hypothetical protein
VNARSDRCVAGRCLCANIGDREMPFPYQNHYNPKQLRIPKGQPHAGEWTGDGSAPDETVQPVFFDPNKDPRRIKVPRPAIIELGALAYIWLSLFNGQRQAVISFKTGEYRRSKLSDEILEYVRQVDDDELKRICPRYDIVQWLTNVSALETRLAEQQSGRKKTPSQFGSDVHVRLKQKIVALGDPNFKAEESYLKGIEADYGTKDSVRIDALEDRQDGTICVYDIKTGQSRSSGLSLKRRAEIRDEIFKAFQKKAQRVILTEIRPQ